MMTGVRGPALRSTLCALFALALLQSGGAARAQDQPLLLYLRDSDQPPALGAAPHPRYGWAVGRWQEDWARRTASFLVAEGARGHPHPVSPGLAVLRYEDVRVTRFALP